MTTVLVVDDSTPDRRLLHTLLSLRGHHILEADDVGAAAAIARERAPQVVITDLTTDPGGDDLVRRLREDPRTADIPVVLYTGHAAVSGSPAASPTSPTDRVVARSGDPQHLLETLESVLGGGTGGTGGTDDPHRLRAVNSTLIDMIRQLEDSQHRFRLVVESAPVGVVLGDLTGEASYVNPSLSQITGVPTEQLLGTGWLDVLTTRGWHEVTRALTGRPADVATRRRDRLDRPGHRPRWLDLHLRHTCDAQGRPRGFVAFIVDVTATVDAEQHRHAEDQRHFRDDTERAATRLESTRRFAGSVAHGYNNALAVILSYGEFLRERINDAKSRGRLDPSTAHDMTVDLEMLLGAGRRAARITRDLQAFGHRGRPPTPTVIDLNASLRPEIAALADRIGPDITLRTDLADGLKPVIADVDQIGQIIRNLVENAVDAMPDGGELVIETAAGDPPAGVVPGTPSGEPEPDTRVVADPQEHVRLTVRDTGHGMPPTMVRRAIEPFFTTKPDSRGGGLGLTAVYGIAHQAGGELVIDSTPEAGTSIHVLFPVAAPTGAPPEPTAPAPGTNETILVVDDEEPVLKVVHRMLTKMGYQVLTASDATEALEVARAHPGPVHCLITDLAMPGLPGTELTRRLRAERPELAVLYMSGYAEPLLHHVGTADDRTNLLPKPFTRVDLLSAVRATMQEHRASQRG